MNKYNEFSSKNEINNIKIDAKEKEEETSNKNKFNHNSIIDKIHSIQASINNKNNSKFVRRKNNFKKGGNDIRVQENSIKNRSKSKNKMRSKSKLKNISKNKIVYESKNIKQNINNLTNNKINSIYNYSDSITEQSICTNNTNNSFFTNNTTNNGLNTNNNIIITINNYNKITPTNIEQSTKTIPIHKSKDNNINNKKKNRKK